jgi:hypothetical protein
MKSANLVPLNRRRMRPIQVALETDCRCQVVAAEMISVARVRRYLKRECLTILQECEKALKIVAFELDGYMVSAEPRAVQEAVGKLDEERRRVTAAIHQIVKPAIQLTFRDARRRYSTRPGR